MVLSELDNLKNTFHDSSAKSLNKIHTQVDNVPI